MKSFHRVLDQLDSPRPFQPPASITVEALSSDPEMLKGVMRQCREDIELMRVKGCAFAHERSRYHGGSSAELCSDVLRHTTIDCGHGTKMPLAGAIETLHQLTFITDDERQHMRAICSAAALERGDAATNLLGSILKSEPHERDSFKDEALKLGIRAPLRDLTSEMADSIAAQLQRDGSRELLTLKKNLLRSIIAAEDLDGTFTEKREEFRRTLFATDRK